MSGKRIDSDSTFPFVIIIFPDTYSIHFVKGAAREKIITPIIIVMFSCRRGGDGSGSCAYVEWIGAFLVLMILESIVAVSASNYNITEGNQSLLVALGRFWSAEQTFELYAPGVVEAVTGYAEVKNERPSEFSLLVLMASGVDFVIA